MPFIRRSDAIHAPVKNAIEPIDRMPFMCYNRNRTKIVEVLAGSNFNVIKNHGKSRILGVMQGYVTDQIGSATGTETYPQKSTVTEWL
jgi:hypothetical protein